MNTNPPNITIQEYGENCYTCTEDCNGIAILYLQGDEQE